MPITTLENVKTLLGITDSSKDQIIEMLIPAVENDYLRIRGIAWNELDDSNETFDYPENAEVVAGQMIGYNISNMSSMGMKSEQIGSYSYTKDDKSTGGYPKSIVDKIQQFQHAK